MNESESYTNSINPADESTINHILDIGINQINLQPSNSSTTSEHRNNISSYRHMKDDLASIQSNINRLERKLFTSITSDSIGGNMMSNKQSCNTFYDSVDYKEKLALRENEMIELQLSLEEQKRINEELRKELADNKVKTQMREDNMNDKEKEFERLKQYKHEFEKMKSSYHLLLKEFNSSEQIRNEQKKIIKELQRDIDEMRLQSFETIQKIKMEKDMIDINKHDDSYNVIIKPKNTRTITPDKKSKKTIKKKLIKQKTPI